MPAQDFSKHPLIIQRFGDAAPTLDQLLSELAVLGTIELSLTPLDEHMSKTYYWMTLHLKTAGSQMVQTVTQPGETPYEAAIRCLVGGLAEMDLHVSQGIDNASSFLDFPH